MSTCPNKDIFSAYLDDELPAPWKETIEKHLRECSECRIVYGRYRAVRLCIQKASAVPEFNTAASFTALLAKREAALKLKQEAQRKQWAGSRWFSASIRVPVPAVAAAVFIFVFMPLVLFFKAEQAVTSAAASQSFTPILPVSLEKQKPISEIDYGILRADDAYAYTVSPKTVNTNVKLFTVGEFARLYSKNEDMFQPVHSTVDLKISSSMFPLTTEYQTLYSAADAVSILSDR